MRRLFAIAFILLLSGCGYRGALVLPDKAPQEQSANQPSANTSQDKK